MRRKSKGSRRIMCLKQINWGKAVLGAVAFAVISKVIYSMGALVDMSHYVNPALS